jgi:hypothetical protein
MQCEVCGNEYEDSFTLTLAGETYVFDCFECAIHALAPTCAHCGCKVIGHGLSREGEIFCCAHCVRVSLAVDEDADGAADDDELDDSEFDLDADDGRFEEDDGERHPKRRW